MSKVLSKVVEANRKCGPTFGERSKLTLPPRSFAILTCVGAHFDRQNMLGLPKTTLTLSENAVGVPATMRLVPW